MEKFLQLAYQLKHLDRAGWLRVGIQHPESVAAHSWGLALLCVALAPDDLDKEKLLIMALIHDLPEVDVGDITPHDGISRRQKQSLESQAALALFPPKLLDIWQECQQKSSPEAQFIHVMDKLDMALQADQYRELADTSEFVQSAIRSINAVDITPSLKSQIELLIQPGRR